MEPCLGKGWFAVTTYRVMAERDRRSWVLRVPNLDDIATQVRRLTEEARIYPGSIPGAASLP
jgi:hypothetical protein